MKHQHITVRVENKLRPGPKRIVVEKATPEMFGAWLRSMPKFKDASSIAADVRLDLSSETWNAFATGASLRGWTVDSLLSHLLTEWACDFQNDDFKTSCEKFYDKEKAKADSADEESEESVPELKGEPRIKADDDDNEGEEWKDGAK